MYYEQAEVRILSQANKVWQGITLLEAKGMDAIMSHIAAESALFGSRHRPN